MNQDDPTLLPQATGKPHGDDAVVDVNTYQAAAEWLLRQGRADWHADDQAQLQQWLAQSPLHQRAWQRLQTTQATLPQIRQAQSGDWRMPCQPPAKATAPVSPHAPRRMGWGTRVTKRPAMRFASAAFAVLATGSVVFYHWANTPQWSLQAQTQVGQSQSIALPDGSQITLNTNSRIDVHYYPLSRQTRLLQGEAFFQVQANAAQPFTVQTDQSQITVVGTAFNVLIAPHAQTIEVKEGIVEVLAHTAGPRQQAVRLTAGTQLNLGDGNKARYQRIAAPQVGAWTSGQMRFNNTPLSQVVAQVSRYLDQPITIESAALSQRRISAVIATGKPEAFLLALPDLLPVRVSQHPDLGWRIQAH